MTDEEEWLTVPGYEGFYEASNLGRIKSIKRRDARGVTRAEMILKDFKDGKEGYRAVELHRDRVSSRMKVHRVIATVFLGEGNGKQVNHKNGLRHDNRIENLEWCTASENVSHAFRFLGRKSYGGHNGKTGSKSHLARRVIGVKIETGEEKEFGSIKDAAEHLGVDRSGVSRCCLGGQQSTKGWIFRYEQERNMPVPSMQRRVRD